MPLQEITLRLEEEKDYSAVELLTRAAFWNRYVPGCDEHYLAHILRRTDAFVQALDFVAVAEGEIVGSIMYSRAQVRCDDGQTMPVLTFGPLSVSPAC